MEVVSKQVSDAYYLRSLDHTVASPNVYISYLDISDLDEFKLTNFGTLILFTLCLPLC